MSQSVKAVAVTGFGTPGAVAEKRQLRLIDLDVPTVGKGEVLIWPEGFTPCGTDEGISKGPHGQAVPNTNELVLGHESCAVVASVRRRLNYTALPGHTPEPIREGDRVGTFVRVPVPGHKLPEEVESYKQLFDLAPDQFHLPGDWMEYGIFRQHGGGAGARVVPAYQLIKLPEGVPSHIACLAEPLSAVMKCVREMLDLRYRSIDSIIPGDRFRELPEEPRVLIIGAGCSGLMATLAFRWLHQESAGIKQFRVVVVSREDENSERASIARELGADYFQVHGTTRDPEEIRARMEDVKKISGFAGFHYILEAAGDPRAATYYRRLLYPHLGSVMGEFGIPHRDDDGNLGFNISLSCRHAVMGNCRGVASVNANNLTDWPSALKALQWGYTGPYHKALNMMVPTTIDDFDLTQIQDALGDRVSVRTFIKVPDSARPR